MRLIWEFSLHHSAIVDVIIGYSIMIFVLLGLINYIECNNSYRMVSTNNSATTYIRTLLSGERPPCLKIFDFSWTTSLSELFRNFLFERTLETRNTCISYCRLSDISQNCRRKLLLICLSIHHNIHLLFLDSFNIARLFS